MHDLTRFLMIGLGCFAVACAEGTQASPPGGSGEGPTGGTGGGASPSGSSANAAGGAGGAGSAAGGGGATSTGSGDCAAGEETCLGKCYPCSGDLFHCGMQRGACCAADETFCDVPEPADACFPANTDCSTVAECNGAWRGCATGETSHCGAQTFACCTDDNPVFCDVSGATSCFPEGTDCASVTECNGSWSGCTEGQTAHCGQSEPLACCDQDFPQFCDIAGAGNECWSNGTDCGTATQCDGTWNACPTGYEPHCGTNQPFACCGGESPVYCDVAGPPPGCWGTGANCGTITLCQGQWFACIDDTIPRCGAFQSACCAAGDTFCDIPDAPGCWQPGTDCDAIGMCDGTWYSCPSGTTLQCDDPPVCVQ